MACELLAWMQMLALEGKARRWETKRLRLRLFSAAGRLIRGARWESGTGWLCAPAWSWPNGPPSTPAALTRCAPSQQRSEPGASSAGQRRIAFQRRAAG
jgi:hypothetical protein